MSSTVRLDKFIADATDHSRAQIKRCIGKGLVSVNGCVVRSPAQHIALTDRVVFDGRQVTAHQPRYIMLNKPIGYICSTEDEMHPSVLNLLDIENRRTLHIAGRLDVDTTGLVLITDDGQWSHNITAPKKKCSKVYEVTLAEALAPSAIEVFEKGVLLRGDSTPTKPAALEIKSAKQAILTIQEGRYHQVKRMFASMGNKVTALHRTQIGHIQLDNTLETGEWRHLTEAEVASIS